MKSMGKFLAFIMACLLLTGCGQKAAPRVNLVTAVEVTWTRDGQTSQATYTQPGKIRRFLYYLRRQETAGYAQVKPEGMEGSMCRIRVYLSDGSVRVWRQRADRFVSVDYHRWKNLEAPWGKRIYLLLRLIPPDPVANPGTC